MAFRCTEQSFRDFLLNDDDFPTFTSDEQVYVYPRNTIIIKKSSLSYYRPFNNFNCQALPLQ